MNAYLGFFICATIIFFAGKKLSYYGDVIADLSGLGKAWIGLILMAAVTSLPELIVGVSSSAIVQSADLAVGDILGSCAFNLGILALMDALVPKSKTLLGNASQSHILAAGLSCILVALAGLGLFLPSEMDFPITSSLGLTSLLLLIVYIISIRVIYTFNKMNISNKSETNDFEHAITLKKAIGLYSIFGLVIIGSAIFLPHFAEQIAEQTGLGQSFVGTLFLAGSTSLPEIAVSIAAVRIGSIDMAVGNLLGSNIFNILILFFDDIAYTKGNILKDASSSNLISAFAVIIMTAIAIIGLIYRNPKKKYYLAWDALLIFIIYLINIFLLYKTS